MAIYIDGTNFHVGQNLRRDRYIREKLRTAQPPWRVIELTARDVGPGGELVQKLRTLAETVE